MSRPINEPKFMKNKLLSLSFFTVLFCQFSFSQNVDLYSTANPTIVTFTTLKGAFDAINAGTRTGTIFVEIKGNTTEGATATLNASGSGSALYTSVLITPVGGVVRTITGNLNGNGLIQLLGADNVTINGLNTGGNGLIISNTSTANTSTIFLNTDATSNTITNCSILGSTTAALGTNGGNIYLGLILHLLEVIIIPFPFVILVQRVEIYLVKVFILEEQLRSTIVEI
jgi:hypothetical protein